jgi:hypothetical protein
VEGVEGVEGGEGDKEKMIRREERVPWREMPPERRRRLFWR